MLKIRLLNVHRIQVLGIIYWGFMNGLIDQLLN